MTVVTFHRKATLDGQEYQPGQTAEIPDHWVYPLIYQGVITVPTVHQVKKMGYSAPTLKVTARDPVPDRG